jgi:hypothetical protein
MRVFEDSAFKKAVKRLHGNQKADLYDAIRSLMEQPTLGDVPPRGCLDILSSVNRGLSAG